MFREELFARELERPEEQELELEAGILRAFRVNLNPEVVTLAADPFWGIEERRYEKANPSGPPHPFLPDLPKRYEQIAWLSDREAFENVQELTDRVMKVEVEAGRVFGRLCLAWCELALVLIRADHQAASYRAAEIGFSSLPVTDGERFRAVVHRVMALAELYSMGNERAEEFLFEAYELDGDESFSHQLISVTLAFRQAPYREAIERLEGVLEWAEGSAYLELDDVAARVIEIGRMR